MFARTLSVQLQPNKFAEFTKAVETNILPLLRKQQGFRDELILFAPDNVDVLAISLWDSKESADRYSRETYPQVLKTLARVIEGTPQVRNYEVAFSTAHKTVAAN